MESVNLSSKHIVEFYRSYDKALNGTTYFWRYGLVAAVVFVLFNMFGG